MDISPGAEPRDVEGRGTRSRTGFGGGRGDYRPSRPWLVVVGKAGFEPAISRSRTERDTRLRYFPTC